MFEKKYDAVIIGAGLGGLMTAAGLVQAKKKVLVLEKADFIGGKYTEIDYKGYKVTTGAWSNMGKNSHIDNFCREVGANIDYITLKQIRKERGTPGLLGKIRYKNGKEFFPTSTISSPFSKSEMQEYSKVMIGLVSKDLEGIDRSKNTSVYDYIQNFTKSDKIIKLLDSLIGIASGLNTKTIPTSEYKIILQDSSGIASGNFGFPIGGIKSIIDALEKVIIAKGGKISTKNAVKKVLIDGNSAVGVQLEDGETIYSDLIINNSGPKNLLTLCGRNKFPSSFLKKVDKLIPIDALAIICGLNKPISEDVPMIITPDCDRIAGIFEPTFFDPSIAPPGKTMIDIFAPLKTKDIKKEIDLTVKDLEDLYPGILDPSNLDFQLNMVFAGDFPAAEGAQTFGQTGSDRIDPKLPVNNLYMVGAEAIGSGVAADLIPIGVCKALDYILGTEKWLEVSF
ncbi:MAG: NAD(P)/FAD-dependent oxidoreductase [Candidatus Helarchaeota archaeon]|nr:NAD(P)/FAD-dependent oxidoreductase [Candidatus Helarchaeota archaeon]